MMERFWPIFAGYKVQTTPTQILVWTARYGDGTRHVDGKRETGTLHTLP